MPKPTKKDPKDATPESGQQRSGAEAVPPGAEKEHDRAHESGYGGKKAQPRNPYGSEGVGRKKRGSELSDADLREPPLEEFDDHIPD